MIDPVTKEITVSASVSEAFKKFTLHLGDWWPLGSHSLSAGAGETAKSVKMEPCLGGAIVETMYDGDTALWGIITDWEPERKVGFTWHLRRPKNEQTHICVEFFPDGKKTLVRLVHSRWDALGDEAQNHRNQYNSGWDRVLKEYVKITFAP